MLCNNDLCQKFYEASKIATKPSQNGECILNINNHVDISKNVSPLGIYF